MAGSCSQKMRSSTAMASATGAGKSAAEAASGGSSIDGAAGDFPLQAL